MANRRLQIFVEVERARVTKILSDIKRSQGDLKGAAEILCELQVETFGSMERREKTEFIPALARRGRLL